MLQKLTLRPGIVRDLSDYSNEGGYIDCDKVRFRLGQPEQIGGWIKYSINTFLGTCRALIRWLNLSFISFSALGTHWKLYIESGGSYTDITPLRKTVALVNDPFTTQGIGSDTLLVNDIAHGAILFDFVTYPGATAFDNFTAPLLNQNLQITTIVDADNYIVTVPTASAASTGVAGGGAAVMAAYEINVGSNVQVIGLGWGAGPYSRGTWSSAYAGIGVVENQLRLWTLANFGEDLMANIRAGAIYYWKGGGVTPLLNRAVLLSSLPGASDVPIVANFIIVEPISRHLIALGANEIGEATQNPLLVRWSAQEDATNWTPDTTNTAGGISVANGSQIIGAVYSQQQILFWTDRAMYSMTFIGPPYTFDIKQVSDSISMISPNSATEARGITYWMDKNNFYAYSGNIQIIPCPVRDAVFKDINFDQSDKITAGVNSLYNEIVWFYPSGSSDENDRYVIYNYEENTWYWGSIVRTAWADLAVSELPLAANSIKVGGDSNNTYGYLFLHEVGYNDDESAMVSFVETADMDIGDGQQFSFMPRFIPDVSFRGVSLTPAISYTIYSRNYPQEALTARATVTVNSSTTQNNVRIRGRQIAMKLDADGTDIGWRLGTARIDVQTDGQK